VFAFILISFAGCGKVMNNVGKLDNAAPISTYANNVKKQIHWRERYDLIKNSRIISTLFFCGLLCCLKLEPSSQNVNKI
jgi:hypothetical protein